jgi:hypothetical protein
MPDPQASDASRRFEPQSETYDPERRSAVRTGTVLNRIGRYHLRHPAQARAKAGLITGISCLSECTSIGLLLKS